MSDHPTSIPSGTQHNSSGHEHRRYFFDTFGITERLLERCLSEALSAGGDYADLYFESIASTSIGLDESLVKSASQGMSAGCGVRVVAGERTGYAYTDDLSADRLLRAGRTAALIASGPAKEPVTGFRERANDVCVQLHLRHDIREQPDLDPEREWTSVQHRRQRRGQ